MCGMGHMSVRLAGFILEPSCTATVLHTTFATNDASNLLWLSLLLSMLLS